MFVPKPTELQASLSRGEAPQVLCSHYVFADDGTLTDLNTQYGAGVTSSATNGASLVSNHAVPDGSSNYEAAMTLGVFNSGVTYTIYLEASSNALLGASSTTGS